MALGKTSTFYLMPYVMNEPFTLDASMLYC